MPPFPITQPGSERARWSCAGMSGEIAGERGRRGGKRRSDNGCFAVRVCLAEMSLHLPVSCSEMGRGRKLPHQTFTCSPNTRSRPRGQGSTSRLSGLRRPDFWWRSRPLPPPSKTPTHEGFQIKHHLKTFNSIQFIFYSPFSQITHLPQRALQSVHIDIPDLWPHIGSGTTPKQPFHWEKSEETFRRATEEDWHLVDLYILFSAFYLLCSFFYFIASSFTVDCTFAF